MLSCLGSSRFSYWADPNATEIRLASQWCRLGESLDNFHHHWCGSAHSDPLYSASANSAGYSVNPVLVTPDDAGNYPPIQHSAGLQNPANFGAAINGLMQAVYAYGGAMLFTEFMSEMRRPHDFIKGMWGAQFFIYVCYMLSGLYMYGFQGQYVQNPSYLGNSPYAWQSVGNVLAMVTALIAAALYGNVGVKGKEVLILSTCLLPTRPLAC